MPKSVTIVFAYYESPRMLASQLANIAGYDPETKRHVHLIVVDDGSPENPARIDACAVSFKLYRCLVDVSWNADFCRNLAVSEAETEWILLTDIDHLVPAKTARALVHGRHWKNIAYDFSRVSSPNFEPIKSHVNSWFMTRWLFGEIGGYDERLAGLYGTDADFRRRLGAHARVCRLRTPLLVVPRRVVPDASTDRYLRVDERERIARIVRKRGVLPPKRLTFPWVRVQ